MSKSLTQFWLDAGRPRPPFEYQFDHPDGREQWFKVTSIIDNGLIGDVMFKDSHDCEWFFGSRVSVIAIRSLE